MSDLRELLDEAVGTYVPRVTQDAVQRRARSRKARQRAATGSVAFVVFGVASVLLWLAFRPTEPDDGRYASPGPGGIAITIPDVVGLPRDEARQELENAGLVVSIDEVSSDDVE